MANIKSAKKRAVQAEKHRTRNRYYKTTATTYVKQARKLMEAGDLENAEIAVNNASKALDKAAGKGIIHKNNAARRKSRLMSALNKAKSAQTA